MLIATYDDSVIMSNDISIYISLVLLAAVVFVGAERAFSPSFQACLSQSVASGEWIGATVNGYVYCSGNFITENKDAITAFADLVAAVFTISLWAATNRQELFTKEALISNNCAFVFVHNFAQFWKHDEKVGHYNWRLRPILRNSGNTPTKNMTIFVECEIRNTPIPPGYPFTPDPQNTVAGMLPPNLDLTGGVVPRTPGAAITPQDIIDAQSSRKFIYIWGVIRYSDVFPRTRPHITRYCYLITTTGDPLKFVPNTPGQPPTPGTLAVQMIHHSENNCIDEGCR